MTRVVRYVGGPLDGKHLDVDEWTDEEIATGTYEVVPGWTDRADYSPAPGGDPTVWHYRGPVPA